MTVPRYILFEPSKNYVPVESQEANAHFVNQGAYVFVMETRGVYFNEPAWNFISKNSKRAKEIPSQVLAALTLLNWAPYDN